MKQLNFEDLEAPSPLSLLGPDDIFARADEQLLRSLGENRSFEKKPAGFSSKDVGEYVSMWANTAPEGGVLAIGIRDDWVFEGLENKGEKYVNDLEAAPDRHCPGARFATRRVSIHRDTDGHPDSILLIRVYYNASQVVVTSSHKAFVRLGDTKKSLSNDEVMQLKAEKGEVRFEVSPSRLIYPDDFDVPSISAFVETVRADRELGAHHSSEDLLQVMHLGKIRDSAFTPNIACDLLFARDPTLSVAGCRIRFLRFDGETEGTGEKWNAVKDEYIEGPIPHLIVNAALLLRAQLRTFSRLDKNGRFVNSPEYPEVAWYEAIVNACAHRSYGNGLGNASITIKMFDDRLQVESPGPFPPFVDPSNISQTGSNPTNPFLMDSLRHLRFVKAAREGTRRMRDTMEAMGLPSPEFIQTQTGSRWVHVTLRNNIKHRKVWVDQDVSSLIGAQIADQLSEDQKKVLNYIAEYGKINISQASRMIGAKTWHSAKNLLIKLSTLGIIEHVHRADIERDPNAHFRLANRKDESRGDV